MPNVPKEVPVADIQEEPTRDRNYTQNYIYIISFIKCYYLETSEPVKKKLRKEQLVPA